MALGLSRTCTRCYLSGVEARALHHLDPLTLRGDLTGKSDQSIDRKAGRQGRRDAGAEAGMDGWREAPAACRAVEG